jgi:hypothetical protein
LNLDDLRVPYLTLVIIAIVGLGVSFPPGSYQSPDSDNGAANISTNTTAPIGLIINQSSISQKEVSRGVPYIIQLSYSNGSFVTTGNTTYTAKFRFNEPFLIADVNKGTFNNAGIVANDTVRFQSTPISKGENKTGVVTFLFEDGLAEKDRVADVDVNLTLDSLSDIDTDRIAIEGESPLFSNQSGTFANDTSIFTNATTFKEVFGESPQTVAPDLVKRAPLNALTNSLDNLTSAQLAGVINTISPANREEILQAAPPLSPPEPINTNFSFGPINSSVVIIDAAIDIAAKVPGIANETNVVVHTTYSTWTPCIALESLEHKKTDVTRIGSIIQFVVNIRNCSNIFENVGLRAMSTGENVKFYFGVDKFDMPARSVKTVSLIVAVPPDTSPGIYQLKIIGSVFLNAPLTTYVIAETAQTTGNVHYLII